MKELIFLVAMPRSGNTVFASVINQNPDIACTANSITLELMKDIYLLKQTDVFQNYPDHKSLDTENPNAFPNRYGHTTDLDKLLMLMNTEGVIAKQLLAIETSLKPENKDICHFIKFDEFVEDPETHLKKLYQFLNTPYYPHYFENLKQIEINGMQYDDTIVGSNMHKVWPGKIRKIYNPYIEKIPEEIKKRYGHITL